MPLHVPASLGSAFTDPDYKPESTNQPPKKKPRGRPFTKGTDPRRQGLPRVEVGAICPACMAGTMRERIGSHGPFHGCSEYPICRHTQPAVAPIVTASTAIPAPHAAVPADPTPADYIRNATSSAAPGSPFKCVYGWCGFEHTDRASAVKHQQDTQHPVINTANGINVENDPTRNTFDATGKPTAAAPTTQPDTPAPMPTPTSTTTSSNAQGDLLAALSTFVQAQAASAPLDENAVRKLIAEAMTGSGNYRGVSITVGDAPAVQIEGAAHKALEAIVTRVRIGMHNLLIVGPAGSGKTTLGEQLARTFGREFATISCSPGMPESALLGRRIPNLTTGEEVYAPSPFVRLYRDGGVFLLDEVDAADATALIVLNSALSNGHLTLPDGTRAERHADFVLVASANTYGTGADRMYVGRSQLDAATLDRFVGATIDVDYDTDLERALCPEREILQAVHNVRAHVTRLKLRRIVGTRFVLAVRRLHLGAKMPLADAVAECCKGWTADDMRACSVKVPA